MPNQSEREAFRSLLIDLLAIRTAEQLGDVELPDQNMLNKYREIAVPRADEVLRKYEQALAVSELKQAIIDELRGDLVARSRAAKLIEVGINVSAVIVGALIGLSQFIFDPAKNTKEIAAVYFALMLVAILQLIGNLYLKFFDKKR